MRHALRVLLAAAFLCVAGSAAATDAGPDPAARLEKLLATLTSVRVDFTQDVVGADGKTTDHAVGTLSLRRPGRFRWDYTNPRQLIVSDGERLWLYDPELEQATVRRVREAFAQTPAMLLSGEARIRDGYTVRDAGSEGGFGWLALTPKGADSDFREIRLGFAGDALKRLEFTDKLNQRTRISLGTLERNVRLDDALFTFTPPKGVDVIGNAR
jgi:outer membrane lipoprotein carrier protein